MEKNYISRNLKKDACDNGKINFFVVKRIVSNLCNLHQLGHAYNNINEEV
jgi:hypothetical protein